MGYLILRIIYLIAVVAFFFAIGWGFLELYRKFRRVKAETITIPDILSQVKTNSETTKEEKKTT